jgi:hypothetical protein
MAGFHPAIRDLLLQPRATFVRRRFRLFALADILCRPLDQQP